MRTEVREEGEGEAGVTHGCIAHLYRFLCTAAIDSQPSILPKPCIIPAFSVKFRPVHAATACDRGVEAADAMLPVMMNGKDRIFFPPKKIRCEGCMRHAVWQRARCV